MTKLATRQSFPEGPLLVHELTHRINNEIASMISVVSRAAARSGNRDVAIALTGVTELLHHHADVYRALQMPEHRTRIDAADYVKQLCLSISRSKLDDMKISLVLAARPLSMQSDRCWRLGMIVYELVTNAARHAFNGKGGEIRVELLRSGPFVECRVLDNGSAPANIRPGHVRPGHIRPGMVSKSSRSWSRVSMEDLNNSLARGGPRRPSSFLASDGAPRQEPAMTRAGK